MGKRLDYLTLTATKIFNSHACLLMAADRPIVDGHLRTQKEFQFAFVIEKRRNHYSVAKRGAVFTVINQLDHDRSHLGYSVAQHLRLLGLGSGTAQEPAVSAYDLFLGVARQLNKGRIAGHDRIVARRGSLTTAATWLLQIRELGSDILVTATPSHLVISQSPVQLTSMPSSHRLQGAGGQLFESCHEFRYCRVRPYR